MIALMAAIACTEQCGIGAILKNHVPPHPLGCSHVGVIDIGDVASAPLLDGSAATRYHMADALGNAHAANVVAIV
jgi:hypothetical protein